MNTNHVTILLCLIVIIVLGYYYQKNKEGFQGDGSDNNMRVYFNQSIQYQQMEKSFRN
jgi:hypothetical protein